MKVGRCLCVIHHSINLSVINETKLTVPTYVGIKNVTHYLPIFIYVGMKANNISSVLWHFLLYCAK